MRYTLLSLLASAYALPSLEMAPHMIQRVHRHHRRAVTSPSVEANCFEEPASAMVSTQAPKPTGLILKVASKINPKRLTATSASAAPVKTSSPKPKSGSYYPDWSSDQFPPEAIDFSKFDVIYYAFAIPSETFDLYFTQWDSEAVLNRLIALAHAQNVKVVVSIGGWTGSKWFSNAVSTSANRAIFVANIMAMVNKFGLDGIDIDWEFPNSGVNSQNIYNPADSANYALFLKALRGKLRKNRVLGAAVANSPFNGPDGTPLKDVSEHAKYLDHILVMNYGKSLSRNFDTKLTLAADGESSLLLNLMESLLSINSLGSFLQSWAQRTSQ